MIGFHVVGPNAGEITQGYAVAMKKGVTKEDFDSTIGIHPTCSEVILETYKLLIFFSESPAFAAYILGVELLLI